VSPIDSRTDLDERTGSPSGRSPADLPRRHNDLPPGHPSSPRYASDGGRPDELRPLTDAEYAEHLGYVEDRLADARAKDLASEIRDTVDEGKEVWSDERDAAHNAIIEDLYGRAEDVPCERKAIVAGGLPGAGKTTVLTAHAGVDLSQYLMINPDSIKEELAEREMIPEIEGLSPMEASDLVHEECSYLAKRLAAKAQAEGKNIIWDVTMSRTDKAIERIEALRESGYSQAEGIFVDVPIDASVRRAEARHRESHDAYLAGHGLGGRYIAKATILEHADSAWGSGNRRNFEQLKPLFDAWRIYDNSVDGGLPVLSDSYHAAVTGMTDSVEGRRR
jgi:predicted kinase